MPYPSPSRRQTSDEVLALSAVNISLIREKFAQLQVLVYRNIEARLEASEISMKEIHVYIANLFPPSDCIPTTADISEVLTAIAANGLCDFINYRPLLGIVKTFGGKELEGRFSQYIAELNGYKIATTMEQYIALASQQSDEDRELPVLPARKDERYLRQLTFKLRLRITETSLIYVDELWDALAHQFLLPPVTVILDQILEGSIVITWLIPPIVVPFLMESIRHNSTASTEFFKANKITSIMIDGICLYEEDQEEVSSISIMVMQCHFLLDIIVQLL